MADDANKYYATYHISNTYRMAEAGDTSRISFLREFVTKCTPVGGTVLDVGCGDMHLSKLMPEYNWVGLDINEGFIPKGEARFINHDIMTTPYPIGNQSIDTVVCSEVLEHVWDLRVVHREVERVLKPKGTYIISTPNYDHADHFVTHFRALLTDFEQAHTIEHIRQYNPHTHRKYLSECGFKTLGHVGADAHYTNFFAHARGMLASELKLPLPEVDVLLGKAFPDFSHTVVLVAQKAV